MSKLKITLVRSVIGTKQAHKDTVKSLGLTKINQTVVKETNPAIMGMVRAVSHLIEVEEVEE